MKWNEIHADVFPVFVVVAASFVVSVVLSGIIQLSFIAHMLIAYK